MAYAILTNEISKAWSGMTTREYKEFKGLKNKCGMACRIKAWASRELLTLKSRRWP